MGSDADTLRPVRREDVARRAGVSAMTVTRALRGEAVAGATRERVLAACRELGYRGNLLAQGLRLNKSWLVGLIVSTVKHEFWSRVIEATERRLQALGYHLVIVQAGRYFRWEAIEFLLARNVEGILLAAPTTVALAERLRREVERVVLVNQRLDVPGVPYVGSTNRDGVGETLAHLAELGHRRVAYLRGPEGEFTAEERLAGFREGARQLGLETDERLVRQANFHYDGGASAMAALLEEKVPFTAVVAANDYVALGAIRVLAERGLRVPVDVSVAGYSGDEVGAYSNPPLTTVEEPVEAMASLAVDRLLREDLEEEATGSELPTRLLVRESTGPARTINGGDER